MTNKDIGTFFKIQNSKLGRCLYPFQDCREKPIQAHSIQNSTTFDLLQSDHHLIQLKTRFNSQVQPYIDFQTVGRNEASTFSGLCSTHDNTLFEPIDKFPLDLENENQKFLLAYRSVLKEYYAVMTGFIRLQKAFQEKIASGHIPGSDPKEMVTIEWAVKAYGTHQYKEKFDTALKTKDFSAIKHQFLVFNNQRPSIACSQLFSADSMQFEDDVLRVVMNILPISDNRTIVVFSSTDKEFSLAQSYLYRCFQGDDNFKKYEVSKTVIKNCENFFINPRFFQKWTNEKKEKIIEYFKDTFRTDHDQDAVEYYLFENEA
jgi:hypothetical protein